MLPFNKNVAGGQANGTQATVEKATPKHGPDIKTVNLDGSVPVKYEIDVRSEEWNGPMFR